MVLEREDRVESGVYQTDLSVVWTSPGNGKQDVGDTIDPRTVVKTGKAPPDNTDGGGFVAKIKQTGEYIEENPVGSLIVTAILGPLYSTATAGYLAYQKFFGDKKK